MPIPAKLGKYNILREINRGSMGIVYEGHDPFTDSRVAIKVSLAESLKNPETGAQYRKMFFNEAHAAGLLTHPNILGIQDAGVEGDTCYLVMEYVEGGRTLKPFCKPDSLLPIEKVVEIVFKCAKALDYAHRQGVVHRDIKPTNILMTKEDNVKISDFSIAYVTKLDATATMPIGMVGSPLYMSPEQVGSDYVTHQTDLFSLGLIMYELLTGRHPFTAENFSRLMYKILNEAPPSMRSFRSEIPDALELIVRKALEKDRAHRYNMGADLATDLSLAFTRLERPQEEISTQERFNAVAKLRFFQGFPDAEIWEVVRACIWQVCEDGADIVVEGDLVDSFYVIVTGEAVVKKASKNLLTLGAGACFGEMGYLARTKRTATVVARGRVALLKVNATVINQASLNCQVRFLKAFLRTLIHRLSVTTEQASKLL